MLNAILATRVSSEWVDYNLHMNDAAYARVFSLAVDALMDKLGLDAAYRERTACTIYTLENHIIYLDEALEGDVLRVDAVLLQLDSKRLRVFFSLYHADDDTLLATSEQMLMHVDSVASKAVAFDENMHAEWQPLVTAPTSWPSQAGRAIRQLKS